MATITLKANEIHTIGELPQNGVSAQNFVAVAQDLSEKQLSDFKGSKVVLNIFPSIDTGVCAASVRTFNQRASEIPGVKVLCLSKDLPFALGRFCGAEGIEQVEVLSLFRNHSFGNDYGLEIIDGPLKGLLSRVVIVLDEDGKVIYSEQVPEITQDPDFDSVFQLL